MNSLKALANSRVEVTHTDVIKWWQDKDIQTIEDYNEVLDNFRIIFACNSDNIEGSTVSYHTTREIFENNSVTGYTGDLTELMQIQNQKLCYDWMLRKLLLKEPITSELIKKMHKLLMRGCYSQDRYNKGERAGNFKIGDYVVGVNDTGSYPDEVEDNIEELVEEINSVSHERVFTIAAYLHCVFENIHPFADGNGRCGRTLMNYFLLLNNYPPVVIYDEDKLDYYKALDKFDKEENIQEFEDFLKGQMVKTWKSRIRRY